MHPARHLISVCFVVLACLACQSSIYRDSGNFTADQTGMVPPKAFAPKALGEPTGDRPALRRLAVVELGEPEVSPLILDTLRKPRLRSSPRFDAFGLDGVGFVSPTTPHRLREDLIQQRLSTQPATTRPWELVSREEYRQIEDQYAREYTEQLEKQSAAEIKRICWHAREKQADAVLLITMSQQVEVADGSPLAFLDLLILPHYLLPSWYFHGSSSAIGWLIDPASERVIDRISYHDRDLRLTPGRWMNRNRQHCLDQMQVETLEEVIEQLVMHKTDSR